MNLNNYKLYTLYLKVTIALLVIFFTYTDSKSDDNIKKTKLENSENMLESFIKYDSTKNITFGGYTVYSAPSRENYSSLSFDSISYPIIGHIKVGNDTFYITRWNWNRFQKGESSNWLLPYEILDEPENSIDSDNVNLEEKLIENEPKIIAFLDSIGQLELNIDSIRSFYINRHNNFYDKNKQDISHTLTLNKYNELLKSLEKNKSTIRETGHAIDIELAIELFGKYEEPVCFQCSESLQIQDGKCSKCKTDRALVYYNSTFHPLSIKPNISGKVVYDKFAIRVSHNGGYSNSVFFFRFK